MTHLGRALYIGGSRQLFRVAAFVWNPPKENHSQRLYLIVKQELPATATNLIISTPRTSCIYFYLRFTNLSDNPGGPTVSACRCPTELISSYLHKIMAPIVRSLPPYVKDSQHVLQIFSDFNFLGEYKLICIHCGHYISYTVFPNGEGLLALKHFVIYPLSRNQARKHCSAWLN